MRKFALIFCLMAVVGCKTEAAEKAPIEAPVAATEAAKVEEAPAAPVEAADPHAAAPGQPAPEQMQDVQAKMQAIEAALKKASEVKGSNDCVKAYGGVEVMMDSLKEKMPEAVREIPPKNAFLKMCKSLPKPIQKCMVIAHSMKNPEECRKIQGEMKEIHKKRIEKVMNANAPKPPPAAPAAEPTAEPEPAAAPAAK